MFNALRQRSNKKKNLLGSDTTGYLFLSKSKPKKRKIEIKQFTLFMKIIYKNVFIKI